MEVCERFVSCFLVMLCTVCQPGLAVDHGANLLWSQKDAYGIARIVSITGDPDSWISTRRANTKYITAPNTHWHFMSLAYQYNAKTVFWSDMGNKNIQGLFLNGSTTAITIADHISAQVEGMAVDWINNNFYWTDALYNWVIILSFSNGKWRVLHTSGTDAPLGIAVHPLKGFLYWVDHGDVPKIERSLLNGKERQNLVDTRLTHPRGIAIDYANDRIYWVDAGRDTVESVDLDGNDRMQHFMVPGSSFYGIAIYKSYLFITDQAASKLRVFGMESSKTNLNFNLGATPYTIIMYDQVNQPDGNSSCKTYGCEHICVHLPDRQPECLCEEGKKIRMDNKTCEESVDVNTRKPSFLISTGKSICYLPFILPTVRVGNETLNLDKECIVNGVGRGITAIDFNWRQSMVYYHEVETGGIFRTRINEEHHKDRLFDEFKLCIDITVDWVASYIYWTDWRTRCISVAKDDGTHMKKLICGDDFLPSVIAVDPVGRNLYFVDEQTQTLQKSLLDGSNRQIFIRLESDAKITRLSINFQNRRLYWADGTKGTIESISLSGGGQTVDFTRNVTTNITGIAFFKDFIIWSEQGDQGGVLSAVRGAPGVFKSLHQEKSNLSDIMAFSPENQPEVLYNPCDVNGTICEELCFPLDGLNFTCACSEGLTLDNGACKSDARDQDSFLLVTDSGLKKIFIVEMTSGNYNASVIPLSPHENPVAIDYDWKTKFMYWTEVDARVIKRTHINGSHEEVFWNLPQDSVTDGMAIDSASGLLYYTDTGLNLIAVISFDTRYHRNLITNGLDQPRAMLANSTHGYIYWSDWGSVARIERAHMDGTNREVVVNTGMGTWPNGIAMDYTDSNETLYWNDAKYNKVWSYNIVTHTKQQITRAYTSHYFGLTVVGQHLYLTDWTNNHLIQLDKSGTGLVEIGAPIFSRPNDIHGYTSDHITEDSSACKDNGGCDHFCFPKASGGRVCACDDSSIASSILGSRRCVPRTTSQPSTTSTTIASTVTVLTTLQTTVGVSTTQHVTTKPITEKLTTVKPSRTSSLIPSTKASLTSTGKTTPVKPQPTKESNEVVTKKTYNPGDDSKTNEVLPGKPSASEQNGDSMKNYVIVGIVAAGVVVVTLAFLVAFLVQKKCKSRKPVGSVKMHYSPNEDSLWNDDGRLMVPMEDRSSRAYETLVEENETLGNSDHIYDDDRQLIT